MRPQEDRVTDPPRVQLRSGGVTGKALVREMARNRCGDTPVHIVDTERPVRIDKERAVRVIGKERPVHVIDKERLVHIDKEKLVRVIDKEKPVHTIDKSILVNIIFEEKSVHIIDRESSVHIIDKDTPVPTEDKEVIAPHTPTSSEVAMALTNKEEATGATKYLTRKCRERENS